MACNCTTPFNGGLPLQNSSCNWASSMVFMTMVNTLLQDHCDISDLCGRITPTLIPDDEYDFIVVGGGAGGSVVAGRLSENPDWKVLLIEQGNDEPAGSQVPSFTFNFYGNSETTNSYPTEPQTSACHEHNNSQCTYLVGKVLGGSVVLSGMTYLRGVPKDYDHWEELGNKGWGYEDVLPFFIESEDNGNIGENISSNYHGVGGPLRVERFPDAPEISQDLLEAARSVGYDTPSDLNDANATEGFTLTQHVAKNGTRYSTARAYLRPARFRSNLHIMLNSTATKINFDKSNGTAIARSVELYYNGQQYNVTVKKEVVVTGGTIGSPRLLLLSGIGPKSDLEDVKVDVVHDLPGVGQNFQNHVQVWIRFNLQEIPNTNFLTLDAVDQYFEYHNGPLSYTGLSQVCGRFSSSENEDEDWPDLQLYFSGFSADCPFDEVENATRTMDLLITLVRPKSKGYIKLRSNDPDVKPIVQPNYLTDDYDIKAIISGIRTAIKIGSADVLKEKYGSELVQEEFGNCSSVYEFGTDDFWECAARYSTAPENHLTGTCKMGPDTDELAVVNPELKVYGTSNVRVADASTFPNKVAANTLTTVVLMAERAVEFIKEDWS